MAPVPEDENEKVRSRSWSWEMKKFETRDEAGGWRKIKGDWSRKFSALTALELLNYQARVKSKKSWLYV